MPITNNNRKILDLKRWTVLPTLAAVLSGAGVFVASSRLYRQQQLYVNFTSSAYLYSPLEDGFVQLPSPALAGTFGAGSCGTAGCIGPTGTATAGTTTTITTNLTLARGLKGYEIEITAGPNAGLRRTITRNDVGANAAITVSPAFPVAITSASSYRLITPRWYVFNAGTLASGSFKVYCFALNTWTTLSQTGLPGTWNGDSKLIATPSFADNGLDMNFASGTATGGTSTTLVNSAKNWTTNQWTNFQVKISAGTGAGQIRTIASNTGTTITVGSAWTTAPDATSVYEIEGNDDFLYLMGNSAVTLYRYSISGNTWTTLTPSAARTVAPGAGMSGHWVYNVPASIDAAWGDENTNINGRRIYSFRGNNSSVLDYYDIAANTWVSLLSYSPSSEVFSTGTKYIYAEGYLYIQKDATGRWFRYSPAEAAMDGFTQNAYPQGAAVVGDTAFDVVEPESGIRYLYMILNTSAVMMRCMVI